MSEETRNKLNLAKFVGLAVGITMAKEDAIFSFEDYGKVKSILEKDYDFFMEIGLMPKNPSHDYPLLGELPLPCAVLEKNRINFNVMEYDNPGIEKERNKIKDLLRKI